jgi:hypothetical protein
MCILGNIILGSVPAVLWAERKAARHDTKLPLPFRIHRSKRMQHGREFPM